MHPQSPPIVTRRSAQQAKIQTRAMVKSKSTAGGSTAATAAGMIGSGNSSSSCVGGGSGSGIGSGNGGPAGDQRKAGKPSAALLEAKRRARNMLKNQGNAMTVQETVTDIFQNVSFKSKLSL